MLVNDKDQVVDSFKSGENFTFKFYLINNTDTTVRYLRLCHEFTNLLNLYVKDTLNEYQYRYIGYPMSTFACALICAWDPLKPKTAKNLWNVSTADSTTWIWPVIDRGSYHTGDSLRWSINDKQITFRKKIYFKIY